MTRKKTTFVNSAGTYDGAKKAGEKLTECQVKYKSIRY